MERERYIIDLTAKRTEHDWAAIFDRFWLTATPKLFEWFGWVLTLGAVLWVAKKTHSDVLQTVVYVMYVAVLFYYAAFFTRFEIRGLPLVKGRKAEFTVSLILSGAIAYLTVLLVTHGVDALVLAQP